MYYNPLTVSLIRLWVCNDSISIHPRTPLWNDTGDKPDKKCIPIKLESFCTQKR